MPTPEEQRDRIDKHMLAVLDEVQAMRRDHEAGRAEMKCVKTEVAAMAITFAEMTPIMEEVREIVELSVNFKRGGKWLSAVARWTGKAVIWLGKVMMGAAVIWAGLKAFGITIWGVKP